MLVLCYHNGDAYSIPFCGTRETYYDVTGTPTTWFDGLTERIGGLDVSAGEAGIQTMYNLYTGVIRTEQTRIAGAKPFELLLEGTVGPVNPSMTLTVSSAAGYPRAVKAIFIITEDGIPVSASNGQTVLNAVVRAHVGTQTVNLPSAGSLQVSASYSGTIPCRAPGGLRPVVFLQDDTTKEILAGVGEFYVAPLLRAVRWSLYK